MVQLQNLVARVIRENVKTQYDTCLLLFSVYEQLGLILTSEQQAILPSLPSPGSVIRTRARIVNQQLWRLNKPVFHNRRD